MGAGLPRRGRPGDRRDARSNGLPDGANAAFGQRLVVERATGLVVGGIGLFGPPEGGQVEFGYGIVESRRGRGYATEAARALVQAALGMPGVTEVTAGVDPANAASVRVLEKAGLSFRSSDGAEAQYAVSSAPG
jgi:[ribosomal protein S5]-alanine N-acetyltransferase